MKPFSSPISWGIVFSLVFYPVYTYLLKYIRNPTITSTVTLFIVVCIIMGPFIYLAYLITQELHYLIEHIKYQEIDLLDRTIDYPLTRKILSTFNITQADLKKTIISNLTEGGKNILGGITSSIGNILSSITNIVFVFLTIFFLFMDGPKFLTKLQDYMPFSKSQKERLIKQVKDIIISTIYGGIIIALIQGFIGGISFSLLGIPAAVLWGLSMFFSSFIPIVGTFIIWGPGVVYLFIKGFYLKGFILILIGVFAISMVDNILRPLIVKGKTKMPTILIFFSILGGINLFGFIGFIMGPLVLAIFVSVLDIFRYSEEEQDRV